MITSQKLHAVFRKASIPRSRWIASKMTRGWGHRTDGYTITGAANGGWRVTFCASDRSRGDCYAAAGVRQLADALDAAGIAWDQAGHPYTLWVLP